MATDGATCQGDVTSSFSDKVVRVKHAWMVCCQQNVCFCVSDVNECTLGACRDQPGTRCLNTFGSFYCVETVNTSEFSLDHPCFD